MGIKKIIKNALNTHRFAKYLNSGEKNNVVEPIIDRNWLRDTTLGGWGTSNRRFIPLIVVESDVLPTKPSELIFLAIADLWAAEASPKHEIYMSDWHSPNKTTKKCNVCFAGAVMAGTLQTAPQDKLEPFEFDYHTQQRLLALDDLRQGCYTPTISRINRTIPDGAQKLDGQKIAGYREIREYCNNPKGFVDDMIRFAWELHDVGQ